MKMIVLIESIHCFLMEVGLSHKPVGLSMQLPLILHVIIQMEDGIKKWSAQVRNEL